MAASTRARHSSAPEITACRILINRPMTMSDRQSKSGICRLTTIVVASPLPPDRAGSGLSSMRCIISSWDQNELSLAPRNKRADADALTLRVPGGGWTMATDGWTGGNETKKKDQKRIQ